MSTTDEEPKEGTIDSVDLVGDDSVDNIPSPGENAEDVTADGASFGDAPVEVQVVNGSLPEEAAAPPAAGAPRHHPAPPAHHQAARAAAAEARGAARGAPCGRGGGRARPRGAHYARARGLPAAAGTR